MERMDVLYEIKEYLQGTADSIDVALNRIEDAFGQEIADEYRGIDENDLLDVNCERCHNCGWWFNSGDGGTDDDNNPLCEQCLDEYEKE